MKLIRARLRDWQLVVAALVLAVAITIVVVVAAVRYHLARVDPELDYLLPRDFSGPFIIILDPMGENLQRKGYKYTIHVPQSRIVRLREIGPLIDFHTAVAITPDGRQIPYDYRQGNVRPDEVALRDLGFLRENDVEAFESWVGKATDVDRRRFQNVKKPNSKVKNSLLYEDVREICFQRLWMDGKFSNRVSSQGWVNYTPRRWTCSA